MLEIQEKQLVRALQTLDMLGCSYAVKKPDGTIVGILQLKEEAKTKFKRTLGPRKASGINYSAYCIPEQLAHMQVGDVFVLTPIGDDNTESIRGNVSAQGSQRFGKGNFMTTVCNKQVQCMRTA